jgi:hypothetical protein
MIDGDSEGSYYTCAECAFTEWYTEDVARLVKVADGQPESYVRASWVNPERGVYR